MKKKLLLLCTVALLALASVFVLASCGKGDPNAKSLMMHLAFDEGSGKTVADSAGKLPDGELRYVFNDPVYQAEPQDPQWRERGVSGGSVLMDGYSNYIRYSPDDIRVSGDAFTVSAWVAPRMFEWDDPTAAEKGTEHLTAVVSQYNADANQGFILGYQRFGAWSFQVGIGDRFVKVWDGGHPLVKYEWNHIAATFDGKTGYIALYLNGEKVNEGRCYENAKISGADEWLYIARNNDGTSNATAMCNMLSGLIDEVKLYKAAVSEKDVRRQYESGLSGGKLPEITFEDIWLQNVLTEDFHKTQYHGGPYQHWMNEPHAPMYYNGKYHLFFQFNLTGPYFRNICWGHLVSVDMVNWTPLKEIITPSAGTVAPDGVWSGAVTYDNDGVPVVFFTAGNDSFASAGQGLISNQNIGMARPKDPTDPNLTEWVVHDSLVVKQTAGQGKAGDFRDPHVWKEGDTWYMLICSASTTTSGGTALLYTTTDDAFTSWTYRGQVYEMRNQPSYLGKTWELPVMLPVSNEDGTITKHVFIISPAPADSADNDIFYFVGTFDKTTYRFRPDAGFETPRRFDFGNNVFTGPSGFIDPKTGRAVIFSIMQDQRTPNDQNVSGWANCVGLAREIVLSSDGSDAYIRPIDELASYEGAVLAEGENLTVTEANQRLAAARGDMLRLRLELSLAGGGKYGIRLRKNPAGTEYTDYYYDAANGTAGVNTGLSGGQNISGNFFDAFDAGDTLTLDLLLDRSLIEGFYNGKKAVSARVYPRNRDSLGLELYASGGSMTVKSLRVTEMKSIYK